jgi:hypothetical protein
LHPRVPVQVADDLICAVLQGKRPAWPEPADQPAIELLMERAEFHGAAALVNHEMAQTPSWPKALREALHTRSIQQAMWELRHQVVLAQALEALHESGVQPILMKGTALAYSLYPNPALRARGDTDLIIPAEAKDSVHAALLALGFERNLDAGGDYVSYQANYTRHLAEGGAHTLDVHWMVNNSEVLSGLFTYEELRQEAVRLPALSDHAWGTSRMHSLLIACMHRATHKHNPYYVDGVAHRNPDRIVWFADIRLLCDHLTEPEWRNVVSAAADKGLRAVTLEALETTHAQLGGSAPGFVKEVLAGAGAGELASNYLFASSLRQQWMDFQALAGIRRKLRLIRELLFPPEAYMRAKFGPGAGSLAWLYFRRASSGLLRRLAHAASRT